MVGDRYAVMPAFKDGEYMWEVLELTSDLPIQKFYFEDEAVEMARFMEKGGAFDGFTPIFMTKSVRNFSPEILNETFSSEFTDEDCC